MPNSTVAVAKRALVKLLVAFAAVISVVLSLAAWVKITHIRYNSFDHYSESLCAEDVDTDSIQPVPPTPVES